MGKYANLDTSILAIFGLSSWTAVGIKTFPANLVAMNAGTEFIRISIIPAGAGINLKSVSGVVIADIFVESNNGSKRVSFIADKLDTFLSGKTLSPVARTAIQLGSSSLSLNGIDPDNSALYRATYTIPFNYFEVMQ